MSLTISEAARQWNTTRATIYNKINKGLLSRSSDKTIDPTEMVRLFGEPKPKKSVKNNVYADKKNDELTIKNALLEQQVVYEKKLREQAENRANQAEKQAEQFFNELKKLTEVVKLIELKQAEESMKKGFNFFKK